MNELNNLSYSLQINYINDDGLNVEICKKMNDDGLELISFQVGDICITEETTNGRILSGKYADENISCGYKYNYEKTDSNYLVNTNNAISLSTTVGLINKIKMKHEFLSAKMVLCALSRGDYRIHSLKKGELRILKIITAETDNAETYKHQEKITLAKFKDDDSFSETKKETFFTINNNLITHNEINSSNEIKIKALIEIMNLNPNSYKDLINLKHLLSSSTLHIN